MSEQSPTAPADDLAARRSQTVDEHMRLELANDLEGVLATFATPRYEVNGPGTIYDGRDEVLRYFSDWRRSYPNQGGELISMRQAQDAIICEFWITGDNTGPVQRNGATLPPTGKSFKIRAVAIFEFAPGDDKLSCERVYFDNNAIWTQLGLT